MKKLLSFIVFILGTIGFTFGLTKPEVGSNITTQTGNSFYTSGMCIDGQMFYQTYHYYLGDTFFMTDVHYGASNAYAYVYDTATKIIVVDPYNVFHFNNNFKWKSNGKPVGVERVILVQNSGYFKTGSLLTQQPNINGGALVGQLIVQLHRTWFWKDGWGSPSYSLSFYPYPNGPQSGSTFSNYYEGDYTSGSECFNYIVHYCGDGIIDTQASMAALGRSNSVANEQCDPNAPGWNSQTCNPNTCQIVQPNPECGDGELNQSREQCEKVNGQFLPGCTNCLLDTPRCSVTVTPNQGNVPQDVTVTSDMPAWATVVYLNMGIGSNILNPQFPYQYTYTNAGSYQIKLKVRNNYDIYNVSYNGDLDSLVARCYANFTGITPPPATPQCNSDYDGQTQYTANSNPWLQNTPDLCTIGIVSGFSYSGTPRVFTWNCVTSGGNSVPCNANQQWCGDSQLNGEEQCDYNDPNHVGWNGMQCDNSCHLYSPGSPVPYLLKEQKTGGMANFTTNQINVEIGDIITYKVNFGNSGTVAATGKVWDVLPPCTNYLTSSIVLPNGVTYNGPLVAYGNQDTVQYKDFLLQAGQGGYMLIQAQVRGTGTNGMNSCLNVMSYLNTGYFSLSGDTLQSQVIAVRPGNPHLVINKELITAGDMTVGSTVVYQITLTNNGNATYHNAYILDILPNAIEYSTSSIQNVTNYQFEEGMMGNNNDYFIRYYDFDLEAGQYAIVYLTGILKEGFNFDQTTNCAFTQGGSGCVLFPTSPIPYIKKWQKTGSMEDFTDETIQVQLGDTIRYRVDFANLGNSAATGQVKDVLPPCVKYVSGSIHGVNPYQGPIVGQQGIQDVVIYKNFPLAAGQTGYMLIEAEIRENVVGLNCSDTRSYLNTGYFRFTDGIRLSDDVLAIRDESAGSEVVFDKTGNKKLMHPGEGGLEFYITVTNQGPDPISNIYVEDIRPDEEQTCIVFEGRTGDELLIDYVSYLRWHYVGLQGAKTNYNIPGELNSSQIYSSGVLYAGQSFNFTIFANVADDPSCTGYYINTGKLTYIVGGQTGTLYDDYDFEVIDDNQDYACLSISSTGSVVELNSNGRGSMRFTCRAADNGSHTFKFDCRGNGEREQVNGNSQYTYTCNYNSGEAGNQYQVSCLVDDDASVNPNCEKIISIDYTVPNCGNGIIEAGEDCDYYGMVRGQSHTIGYYLNDRNPLIRAYDFEDPMYSCRNCKIISGGNYVYEPAECLYTDTPISVMNNEIMPFWWRLWIKDSEYTDNISKCNSWSDENTTLLYKPSMKCYFAVYNGNHKQGDDVIQTFVTNCFNNNFNDSRYHIYDYFKSKHQTTGDGASISTINTITSGLSSHEFGEYKLVLEKVEYDYCNNGRQSGARFGAVCEVNFAVTKPYVMQISTFGVNPVGTNGGRFLDDFYDMQGNKLLNKTDLASVMNVSGSTYASEENLQQEIQKFIDKYGKLAVKVNVNTQINKGSSNTTTLKDLFYYATTIKKVPNQNIYFLEGNGKLTLHQDKIKKLQNAYTIFVSGMNVEIEGDVSNYAMIITTEHIIFKDGGPDSKDKQIMSCANGGQVVQGLFIAGKGFKGSDNLWNTKSNELWCPWGGLHVKGVLIGSGVVDLMNSKRSQLNSWFNVQNVSARESKVRQQRREKIVEGAAVLIEYNPSLWKTLPPGAEIFTESLEVYRK